MSALCLTLAERSPAALQEKIEYYADRVAFIEARLDYLSDPACLPQLPPGRTRFIATCRPVDEGGLYAGPERERLEILRVAARGGFAWIDLERGAFYDAAALESVSVLRSHHDFSRCPADLAELFSDMTRLPGQGVKIAVTPADGAEAVRLVRWAESLSEGATRVLLGMGAAGQPARVLAPLLGSLWTYVAENSRRTVAPGQFTLTEAAGVLHYEMWSLPHRRPAFYGIVSGTEAGFPICRALNGLFDRAGLKSACLPLQASDPEPWLDYLRGSSLGFRGLAAAVSPDSGSAPRPGPSTLSGEPVDSWRRTETGWQAASIGLGSGLKPGTLETDPAPWVDWVLGQFRFWTGRDGDRDCVIEGLEREAEAEDPLGG